MNLSFAFQFGLDCYHPACKFWHPPRDGPAPPPPGVHFDHIVPTGPRAANAPRRPVPPAGPFAARPRSRSPPPSGPTAGPSSTPTASAAAGLGSSFGASGPSLSSRPPPTAPTGPAASRRTGTLQQPSDGVPLGPKADRQALGARKDGRATQSEKPKLIPKGPGWPSPTPELDKEVRFCIPLCIDTSLACKLSMCVRHDNQLKAIIEQRTATMKASLNAASVAHRALQECRRWETDAAIMREARIALEEVVTVYDQRLAGSSQNGVASSAGLGSTSSSGQ